MDGGGLHLRWVGRIKVMSLDLGEGRVGDMMMGCSFVGCGGYGRGFSIALDKG